MYKAILTIIIVVCVFVGVALAQSGERGVTVSERWEYKLVSPTEVIGRSIKPAEMLDDKAAASIDRDAMEALNKLGSEGWEMFAIDGDGDFFLKRRLGGA